jgi:hypothetical protein
VNVPIGKMLTVNQLLDVVKKLIEETNSNNSLVKLLELENELKIMKKAPELINSCNIDFKIDNPEYYLNRIKSILEKYE